MHDHRPPSENLTVDEDPLEDYSGAVPTHVAIIMDGNGRWARDREMPRIRGHRAGARSVRSVVESCRYLGVDVLTVYAFSSENWERPEDEITGLMTLFDVYIEKERERLIENDVRIEVIGDRSKLPDALVDSISGLEEATADQDQLLMQVAVSYGGREEILRACRRIASDVRAGAFDPEQLDADRFESYLYTGTAPDPDLIVRTSGEKRISNFLLWQAAYSEFVFVDTLWPEFDEYEFVEVLREYDARERRYGKTGEQIRDD